MKKKDQKLSRDLLSQNFQLQRLNLDQLKAVKGGTGNSNSGIIIQEVIDG